jgi:TetR/AcrR family transcriptional regulator, cholesterol catabolism regulator
VYQTKPVVKSTIRKQQIYEAAARLFQQKGYPATSMRELAEVVELRASSLYSHIGSKEEILRTICFDNAQRYRQGLAKIEEQSSTPVQKLKTLLRLHIHIALEEPTSVTVFNDEWRHLSEPHLSDFLAIRRNYEQRVRHIIQQGIDLGQFKHIAPNLVVNTLFSSLRWLYDWHKPHRKVASDELETQLLDILLGGILLPVSAQRNGQKKQERQ